MTKTYTCCKCDKPTSKFNYLLGKPCKECKQKGIKE